MRWFEQGFRSAQDKEAQVSGGPTVHEPPSVRGDVGLLDAEVEVGEDLYGLENDSVFSRTIDLKTLVKDFRILYLRDRERKRILYLRNSRVSEKLLPSPESLSGKRHCR